MYKRQNEELFPNLRVVAGRKGGGTTIALLNASDSTYTFRLKMNVGNSNLDFAVYSYTQTGYKIDENSFPVAEFVARAKDLLSGEEEIKILPRSFKLYTNIKID